MINESIHDNAALKFVFLAGGPGAGKSHVANELFGFQDNLSFGSTGMKLVSFDRIFEKALEKLGYSKDLSTLPKEEFDKLTALGGGSLRQRCRDVMKKQMAMYAEQGLGMVFDGTGQVPYSYEDRKADMEDLGYDCHLLFVETPLETALERNAQRERKLPEETVKSLHHTMEYNKKLYQKMFGKDMIVINNDKGQGITAEIRNQVNKIVTGPLKNPLGQHFLHTGERKKRTYTPRHVIKPKVPQYYYPNEDPAKKKERERAERQSKEQGRLFPAGHGSSKEWSPTEQDDAPVSPEQKFKQAQSKKRHHSASMQPDKRKQMGHGGTPMPKVEKETPGGKDKGLEKRIFNPETGNDILVKTALGYPPDHPMRIQAEKYLKK